MFPLDSNFVCNPFVTETIDMPDYSIQHKALSVNLSKTLGQRVRYARVKSGLTIERLCERIGYDKSSLIDLEHDRINPQFIQWRILYGIIQHCHISKENLFDNYLLFCDRMPLKQMRTAKGIKQNQIADYFGVARQTVSDWEHKRKRPSQETWQSLIDYLNS